MCHNISYLNNQNLDQVSSMRMSSTHIAEENRMNNVNYSYKWCMRQKSALLAVHSLLGKFNINSVYSNFKIKIVNN